MRTKRQTAYKWLSLIILPLIIAGCNLVPKYAEPDPDIPCEWHNNKNQEFAEETIDCFRWWESLNDPMLTCLIERAAWQNLDLHIALTRICEARLAEKGAQASLFPHLDGSISYSYANFNQRTLNNILGCGDCKHRGQRNLNVFEAGFDAEWEIDLFGMRIHQKEALAAATASSQEAFAGIWVTLSAEIARYYIELRGFQQRLHIVNRNIEAQSDILELTNSLMNSGFANTIDQLQVTAELSMLKAQKPELEFLIQKNIHHLSTLLGYPPAALTCELQASEALPQLPCRRPIGIPSELLRRRPDIRQAEKDFAAATANVGVAVAALFPRLSLTGFIGEISTLSGPGSWTTFLGPQLLFPIFNSKMLKDDVCLNQIKVQQAMLHYQKTVLEALEETENSIAAFHYELEKNRNLEQMKQSSLNAYLMSLQLYQTGFKNYVDVQTQHLSFLAAENAFLQSEIDLLIHYIALYKALGGGWEIFCSDSE